MKTIIQQYSSKNTSINTKKIPRVYNMINLELLRGKTIFDYGVGKPETVSLIRNFLEPYDVDFIAYDKYNLSPADNTYAFERRKEADLYICSNVLNVIKEYDIIQEIIDNICDFTGGNNIEPYKRKAFLFKIYEGNKTGIGKVTKKDCYQRNDLTKEYVRLFDWTNMYPFIYKKLICNLAGKHYIKKGR